MFNDVITALTGNILKLPIWFFWELMAFLTGFSLNAFYRLFRWFQYARLIENVPTAKIRSAAQGYVELSGIAKLMDGPIIVSPLTGKTCVWYSYIIEEKADTSRTEGHFNSAWQIVEQGKSEELFLLKDETGHCVIDPDDADVVFSHSKMWHKRHVNPHRRYSEQLIRVGNPLYAIGFFKTVADIEQQQTRQQVAHLLRQWKQDPGLLLHRFDQNRNNQLDPDEWEKARLAAESDVRSEQGLEASEEQLNVMMSSDVSDQAYILSSEPEAAVIRQYRWRALKSLGVFFVFGSVAVWLFNVRFGL